MSGRTRLGDKDARVWVKWCGVCWAIALLQSAVTSLTPGECFLRRRRRFWGERSSECLPQKSSVSREHWAVLDCAGCRRGGRSICGPRHFVSKVVFEQVHLFAAPWTIQFNVIVYKSREIRFPRSELVQSVWAKVWSTPFSQCRSSLNYTRSCCAWHNITTSWQYHDTYDMPIGFALSHCNLSSLPVDIDLSGI